MSVDPAKTSLKQLEAEQAAWEASAQERANRVRELNIALEAIGPKVTRARDIMASAKQEVEELGAIKRNLSTEIEALRTSHTEATASLAKVQADLTTLDEIAGRKQAEIDADMQAYGRRKRSEYDNTLADLQGEIRQSQTHLDDLTAQITEAQSRLDTARQTRVAERTSSEAEVAQLNDQIKHLTAQLPKLEHEIEVANTQLRRASLERDEAAAERDKARIEHNNFVKYESQARDILDTKDRELQQKAANIVSGEHRLKAQRSFLAELN